MANRKIDLMILKQLLQLKAKGYSNRRAGEVLGISRNTVNNYVQLLSGSGMDFEAMSELSLSEIQKLVDQGSDPVPPGRDEARYESLQKQINYYLQELKHPGATYQQLWFDYKEAHPDGYAYTQFKEYLKTHQKKQEVRMVIQHKYGDKLFIDFTGQKLRIVDRSSGEVEEMEVFIGILGGSQYTYVEACSSQKMESFIRCCVNCLEYIGGVPQALVPDNLKSAVQQANNYEPLLNRQYKAMSVHYDTVIVPARAVKPRDKALVEGAVKLVYQRIFYPLRNHIFFSLAELNEHIWGLLKSYNARLFQGRDHSRQDLFLQHEKHLLKALAPHRFEVKTFKRAKVQKNTHLWIEKHYYSVPHRYMGQRVQVQYNELTVEVFYNHERIAIHKRSQQPYRYTTVKDHLPSTHKFVLDWHPDRFIKWGQKIGTATGQYIEKVLDHYSYPEQAYKSCLGILNLGKKYSNERLEKACIRALHYGKYSYRTVENILIRKLDKLDEAEEKDTQLKLPLHDNIRGADYYE